MMARRRGGGADYRVPHHKGYGCKAEQRVGPPPMRATPDRPGGRGRKRRYDGSSTACRYSPFSKWPWRRSPVCASSCAPSSPSRSPDEPRPHDRRLPALRKSYGLTRALAGVDVTVCRRAARREQSPVPRRWNRARPSTAGSTPACRKETLLPVGVGLRVEGSAPRPSRIGPRAEALSRHSAAS